MLDDIEIGVDGQEQAEEAALARTGKSGELEVELRLIRQGWHAVRLDTAQMASNADLLAVNRYRRVAIQVKTTDSTATRPDQTWLPFGYATGYLSGKASIFNSKRSPLIADVVVGVSFRQNGSKFVVMPVGFAESLCRLHCDYWAAAPKRNGAVRSTSFPIYMMLSGTPNSHAAHHERTARNLQRYQDRWDVLTEPVEKLHDPAAWPLLD